MPHKNLLAMNEISDLECVCLNPECGYKCFTTSPIGVDKTNNRHADVRIDTCVTCGRKWLHYHVEYEAFSQSGRWYRGLLLENEVASLTPENAVQFLESLPWHIYGGSYFATSGRRGTGRIIVDLFG